MRFNGRVFEAIEAARQHRRRCDLYHAALVVELDGDRYTIELAPSPNADEASRGVVATGAVGSRYAGWLRLFRYEVRCWRGGSIPDLGEAVGGPRRLSSDPRVARRLLDLVATVPTPVWGRDELKAGEMWNSNSMIAWLIATAGLPTDLLRPPPRGRAPGWDAGLEVARRMGLDRDAALSPSRSPLTESNRCASSKSGRRCTGRRWPAGGGRRRARRGAPRRPAARRAERVRVGPELLDDLDPAGHAVGGQLSDSGPQADDDLAVPLTRRATRARGRRARAPVDHRQRAEVHRRRADEAGDEDVGRVVVERRGVSHCCSRPSRSTATRWPSVIASTWSWVT